MPAKTDPKVALVTGAAMGIGAAIAEQLSRDGMTVLVSDIKLDEAEKTAQGFRKFGLSAEPVQLDVAQPASIDTAFEQISQTIAGLAKASSVA
jgi:3-oxoacyl-[acyl-carrier protein] reductase